MVRSTLPVRNYSATERITLPLTLADREVRALLRRPGQEDRPETLDIGFIGRERLGVNIDQPLTRGVYTVSAERDQRLSVGSPGETVFSIPLAVNGDSLESELDTLTREDFEQKVPADVAAWVDADEPISLAGSQVRGQDSWWWLTLAILGLLLLELLILAANMSPLQTVQATT
jgi:hypothetical protein